MIESECSRCHVNKHVLSIPFVDADGLFVFLFARSI